ncbi:translation initiation factor IF-3, partial [Patescibacteria group bacterium]
MKRIRFRKKQAQRSRLQDLYPVNDKIRSPEIEVIDENGEHLGVLATYKAVQMAKEKGLDLVAVAPKANPPVAKILDYGSFKYQKEKTLKKQKAQLKKVDNKELRLSPRISEHDLQTRIKQGIKFLNRGDKLNITVILKGRERQHPELVKELVDNFIKTIDETVA